MDTRVGRFTTRRDRQRTPSRDAKNTAWFVQDNDNSWLGSLCIIVRARTSCNTTLQCMSLQNHAYDKIHDVLKNMQMLLPWALCYGQSRCLAGCQWVTVYRTVYIPIAGMARISSKLLTCQYKPIDTLSPADGPENTHQELSQWLQ